MNELNEFVRRMLEGDDDAFCEVYRALGPLLERSVQSVIGRADSEDVAAETWVQAHRDLTSFNGDAVAFQRWLMAIGRHRALDHLRALGRRPKSAGRIDELPHRPADDDVEQTVAALLSTEATVRLVRSLPGEQAAAVMLRSVVGLDAKSAGHVLGRSPGAVRMAAHRGLRALSGRASELSVDLLG